MRPSIPLRLLIPGLILVLGLLLVTGNLFLEVTRGRESILEHASREARLAGMLVTAEVAAAYRVGRPAHVGTAIEAVQGDRDLSAAAVVGPDGHIIEATRVADIGTKLGANGFGAFSGLTERALEGGTPVLSPSADQEYLRAAFPVRVRSNPQLLVPNAYALVLLEYNLQRRRAANLYQSLMDTTVQASLIALIALLLWLVFHHRLLRRLQRLGIWARRIGEGHFAGSLDEAGSDEIGQLADELRQMATRLEHNNRQLTYQALHDGLTGLLNRWGFERELDGLVNRLAYEHTTHGLLYIDIDQFRVVNKAYGAAVGDELLRQVGLLIENRVFARDRVARIGGADFAVLLEDCPANKTTERARSLRSAIEEVPFSCHGRQVSVTVSVGVVPLRHDTRRLGQALAIAEGASHAAKEAGDEGLHVWHEADDELERHFVETSWVPRIRSALEEDRFQLYAQRIIPISHELDDGRVSYEVLVRMVGETGRLISPGEFLGPAERYHLANRIDRWVTMHAIEVLRRHPEQLASLGACSINLSGLSLGDHELIRALHRELVDDRALHGKLCFEITETAAITNLGRANELIERLRGVGCHFALDDFGSGVSSFGYLKNLDVDFIKIDGMFVRDILDDPIDRAVVRAIHDVARQMGKRTIAEFVESRAILDALADIGVDYAQGFGIHKPQPLEDLLEATTAARRLGN